MEPQKPLVKHIIPKGCLQNPGLQQFLFFMHFFCFLSFPSLSSRLRFSTSFSFDMIKVNPEQSKLQKSLIMHYVLMQIFADSVTLINRGSASTFHSALDILKLGSTRRLISPSLSYQKVQSKVVIYPVSIVNGKRCISSETEASHFCWMGILKWNKFLSGLAFLFLALQTKPELLGYIRCSFNIP